MTALTNALAAVDGAMPQYPTDQQLLIRAKCRGLLRGYDARWSDAPYVPVAVEETMTADLPNVDSKGVSRTFQIAGKVDLVCRYNEKLVLFDHKTTSQDISDPNGSYWRQLAVEGQVTHYYLLLWLLGRKVDGAVWDVTKKPSISPKKLTKAERASVVAEGRYFDVRVADETRAALANGEERETLDLYEARLAHDCTQERPDRYFQRRQVLRMDSEILEYARELWAHSQDMLHSRQCERFPRNSGACLLYGSPCKYLGVCSGYDRIDSDRWQRREWVHNELPVIDTDKELLTNSRVRCFQTCRRKERYDYQLGLERYDEEEKEALWFGSAYHAGLNAWWSTNLEAQHEHGHATSVSEIEQHDRQAALPF